MQVSPQEKIGIAALISDPSDSTAYFVKAVLRDTMTNAVLGSVKLTQDPNNSRRFFGYLEAPGNNTPTGRHVNVTTSIYTDAGYSVYSQNYQEVVTSYIVAQRWTMAFGGAGSGSDLYAPDYRKILSAALKDTIEPVFARITKLVGAPKKAVSRGTDPGLESRLIAALRASQEPTDGMQKQLASFEKAMKGIVQKIDGQATTADLKEALQKVSDAAETVYGSFMYSALNGVPMPAPKLPEKEKSTDDILREERGEDGARAPSQGVVPVHVLAKKRPPKSAPARAFAPVPPLRTAPKTVSALMEARAEDGSRRPSPGVVPSHIVHRNKAGLQKAGIL